MDTKSTFAYRAPAWLPGGHLQTLYPPLLMPRPRVAYWRERWDTPDDDFIDLDWLEPERAAAKQFGDKDNRTVATPLVVLFHGLEGGSNSHYSAALMAATRDIGWRGVVVHFRGCSGEINRLRRAYHSGDSAEIDWILRRLRDSNGSAPLFAVGVSLGGNALLKWLGEQRAAACKVVDGAAAISAPVDLMAAGNALDAGFNLILYTQNFLSSVKRKTRAKLELFPDLCDHALMLESRTLRAFDNAVTAPLHGYRDTDDYWTRGSSKPGLINICVPTLIINAKNDPFLPASALPRADEVSSTVTLVQPDEGGHVGFVGGAFPGSSSWLPATILRFFAAPAAAAANRGHNVEFPSPHQ